MSAVSVEVQIFGHFRLMENMIAEESQLTLGSFQN